MNKQDLRYAYLNYFRNQYAHNELIESKTLIVSVKGDTSGDGNVTILDLLQVQKHIKGVKKISNASLKSADTSLDTKVTILDLLQVQKHIKGIKKLLFSNLGLIPVNRKIKDHNVLEHAYNYLNNDKVIGIFPEGTFGKGKILYPVR